MNAAQLFVKCLENEGVKHVFGLPGEENIGLMDALRDSSIQFVLTRHEQGAAFMADVHGRLTGKAGVCLATLGPGATNLLTGVADANMDSAPVVAITGQGGRERSHKESHQYINVVQMFKPITKWNTTVTLPHAIPEVVRKAFKIAEQERPGATHIEFPEDVAAEKIDHFPLPKSQSVLPNPQGQDIDKVWQLLEKAKNPIVLVGNGLVRAKATLQLERFLEANPLPVATTFMSKGALSDNHPLNLMTIGLQMRDYILCGFEEADLVVTVGYELVEYAPRYWNPDRDKKIIHIAPTPAEVDEFYVPDIEIVADIEDTLKVLAKKSVVKPQKQRTEKLKQFIEKNFAEQEASDAFPLKPQRIIAEMRKAMHDDDILISDVGAHKLWIARMYRCFKPNTCVISNGFASMGIALPGAIAAKLVSPEKKVLAASGDGGFLMNVQEMETAVRLKQDFIALVFNDQRYGVIEWKQQKHYGRTFGVEFSNPDFVKLAESFGAHGHRIERAGELAETLDRAFKAGGVHVIDVPVDYAENQRLGDELGKRICPM